MPIGSICTLSNKNLLSELVIMLRSFDLFNKYRIYVGCDGVVKEALKGLKLTQCELITWRLIPDSLSGASQRQGGFKDLTMWKMAIMLEVLKKEPCVVFYDADMVFLNPMVGIDLETYEAALTPHYMVPEEEKKWGRFNSGCVGTRSAEFVQEWRRVAVRTNDHTADQKFLMDVAPQFKYQELGMEHNFGPWRLYSVPLEEGERRRRALTVDDTIRFEGKPLVNLHTHVRKFPLVGGFNDVVVDLLRKATDPLRCQIREWVMKL